jgi:hypothetical protein
VMSCRVGVGGAGILGMEEWDKSDGCLDLSR